MSDLDIKVGEVWEDSDGDRHHVLMMSNKEDKYRLICTVCRTYADNNFFCWNQEGTNHGDNKRLTLIKKVKEADGSDVKKELIFRAGDWARRRDCKVVLCTKEYCDFPARGFQIKAHGLFYSETGRFLSAFAGEESVFDLVENLGPDYKPEPKLKVGDEVLGKENKIYKIISRIYEPMDNYGWVYALDTPDGRLLWHREEVLLDNLPPKKSESTFTEPKFKVGDRVYCEENHYIEKIKEIRRYSSYVEACLGQSGRIYYVYLLENGKACHEEDLIPAHEAFNIGDWWLSRNKQCAFKISFIDCEKIHSNGDFSWDVYGKFLGMEPTFDHPWDLVYKIDVKEP